MTGAISAAVTWLRHCSHLSVSRRSFTTSRAVSREQFVRDRENVNIVTLGASQHGKTTIASRMTEALAPSGVPLKTVQEIDHSASERENQRSENVTHLELWRKESALRFSLGSSPAGRIYDF